MKSTLIIILFAIAALAFVQFGTGCAGLDLTFTSPYGDVRSRDGTTIIHPRPIIIPAK